jgi:hypothetical protein
MKDEMICPDCGATTKMGTKKRRLLGCCKGPGWAWKKQTTVDFKGSALKATKPKKATLFDRPDLADSEIESGLMEYRSLRSSAQDLARRWGCEVEAIYAADVELSARMKARERELV